MSEYIIKKYDLKALDIDKKTKSVKIAFSQTKDVDKDNDLILPTAFEKTFKERGPQGTNEIWHMMDHGKTLTQGLSKFKELFADGTYAGGLSIYKNSFAWREVAWPLYDAGDITQHSIGFQIVDQEETKSHNIIKEIALYEGSAVLWGANPHTPTMEVVKALLGQEEERDITAAEKIDELIKRIKNGRYQDENASLLVIELKRLQFMFDHKNIADVFKDTTGPETKSTLPEINSEGDKIDYSLIIKNVFQTWKISKK